METFEPVPNEPEQVRTGVGSVVSPWGARDVYGMVLFACTTFIFPCGDHAICQMYKARDFYLVRHTLTDTGV